MNGSEVFLKRKIIWFKKRLFSVGKAGGTGKFIKLCQKENQIAPENAYVSFSNSEFTIVPETEGSELNAKEAYPDDKQSN